MKFIYIVMIGFSVCFSALAISAPSDVISQIQAQAEQDFPSDYSTQKYQIRRQIDAYDILEQMTPPYNVSYSVFYDLKKKANQEFPNDYSTQLYSLKSQMKAYIDINKQNF